MRKLLGLLLAIALAVPAWSQNQPTPSPSPTAQANQAATKEPEALTRAKACELWLCDEVERPT